MKAEMRDMRGGSRVASLTIEAALGLTIFIFMIICLIMPMKMLNTQRKVQMTLEAVSRELSQFAYIKYRKTKGEQDISAGRADEKNIMGLFSDETVRIYLRGKINEAAGKEKIEKLDFSKTKISENGEKIELQVDYRLKLPFSIFRLSSVPASSGSIRRGWIGSEGGRNGLKREGAEDEEIMVYVGNNMSRYHWSKDCHYLSNDISEIPYGERDAHKSISGTHYKPCSVCGKDASPGSVVYVMPNGAYYHSRKDCSSLASYVRGVPLQEVEYLGECSYCRRKKAN